tara:strand:+ start:1182 stop:1397 length:216 start_codon:yes stop_codon:yes gene_type:complete
MQTTDSDIPPHRALLSSIDYELCPIDGLNLPMIRLKREGTINIKIDSWAEVIRQKISVVKKQAAKKQARLK